MNHCLSRPALSISLVLALCMAPAFAAKELDPAAIGDASGAKPNVAEDGVVRIGWSRTDVAVTVDGMTLPPAAQPDRAGGGDPVHAGLGRSVPVEGAAGHPGRDRSGRTLGSAVSGVRGLGHAHTPMTQWQRDAG